jgi:DNA-binding response OmpR family regulator
MPKKNTSKPTILILDDDPDAREPLASYLAKRNYHILTAATNQEAIAAAKEHSPEIILCDVKPEKDGQRLAVLKEIKEIRKDIVCYCITSPHPEIEAMALALGAKEILHKPLGPEELEEKLKEAIS